MKQGRLFVALFIALDAGALTGLVLLVSGVAFRSATLFYLSAAPLLLFGAFMLWWTQDALILATKRLPWWYAPSPWRLLPDRYARPAQRTMAILAFAASLFLVSMGTADLVR